MSDMYGFLTYESDLYRKRGWINLGDYVQTIAAKQFLPVSGIPIARDNMSNYHGEQVKMIMNAWYMDCPENFPPSKNIEPFYTSIHINSVVSDKIFSAEAISHLKLFSPIGCRDYYTVNLLAKYDIPAYYSGCMTLTLGESYKRNHCTDDIYFVDVMYDALTLPELARQPLRLAKRILNGRVFEFNHKMKVMQQYFDKDLLSKAKFMTQMVPYVSFGDGLKMAHDFLLKLSSAKLVVTSRIHTALPCLAMGTPVIFINGGFKNKLDNCRFDGLLEFFNRIDVDDKGCGAANFMFSGERINLNTIISNNDKHLKYASSLIRSCKKFIA
ncbi:Polysaccharide pyruvyl transferase [Serratia grimesii]|uniref:polysaccharide pyruvyl transferase family protein n=1 Tax=Serratia grimesii TaxID=82995 RepID=UPI0021797600|nr:polysaccharide pyruvyl transferase family protein [Serratia grimesii]CAI0796647.1 Polysaccharide pyruvyl transferase [Serratia grimesii]CAI2785663.1 Polysaccharide pyruvyl transferase [Serratia grimesii]